MQSLWVIGDMEWTSKDSIGRSGGMLIMWKPCIFHISFCFRGEGFVGISVLWKDIHIYLINIYSSCNIDTNRRLWNQLCEFKSKFPKGGWCVVGDFNIIKKE